MVRTVVTDDDGNAIEILSSENYEFRHSSLHNWLNKTYLREIALENAVEGEVVKEENE